MKKFLWAVALLASLVLGSRELQAQPYGRYYYGSYWDAIQYENYQNYLHWQQYLAYLQLHDPYYDLHVMHYQLYLRQYQPYQVYQPCCYEWGVVAQPSLPIRPEPRPVIDARGQAIVGPLPRAVGPLPPGVGSLPSAIRNR